MGAQIKMNSEEYQQYLKDNPIETPLEKRSRKRNKSELAEKLGIPKQKEASVHQQIVNYLKSRYPDVLFRTDFAAGIKMSMFQAVKHKRLQHSRAFPDICIFHPTPSGYALFLELKRSRDEVYKANGELRSGEHIAEQNEMRLRLNALGYHCSWGFGFEETKRIIDLWILNGEIF